MACPPPVDHSAGTLYPPAYARLRDRWDVVCTIKNVGRCPVAELKTKGSRRFAFTRQAVEQRPMAE